MMSVLVAMGAILLGTWFRLPTLAPVLVGLVMGFVVTRYPARKAALAAMLAWGGVLLAAAVRGDAIRTLGNTLGGAMGVPWWAVFVVTLLYPAILAASAAWLSLMLRDRFFMRAGSEALLARRTSSS